MGIFLFLKVVCLTRCNYCLSLVCVLNIVFCFAYLLFYKFLIDIIVSLLKVTQSQRCDCGGNHRMNNNALTKQELRVLLNGFRNDLKNDTHNFFEKQVDKPSSTDMKLLKVMKKYYRKERGFKKRDYFSTEFLKLVIPFDDIRKKFDYEQYILDYLSNSGYIVNVQGQGLILMPKGYDAVHDIKVKKFTIISINIFTIVGVICAVIQVLISLSKI